MPLVATSTTGSTILNVNKNRKSFIIQNEDGAINVFIKKERPGLTSVSDTDHDHRIGPGGLFALNWVNDGPESIQERWTIVAASGTPSVSIFETEDVVR